MPTLSDREIADLVLGTMNELGPPRFQMIAQDLQDYEVLPKWLRKDKVQVDHGIGIQRTLMTKLPELAKHVGLFEVDEVDVKDLLSQINIPWRHARTAWAFERRETLMNRGRSLIVKVIEPRRVGAMVNLADVLEARAWSCPDVDDKVLPYGLPYWVVANATTGFNGGAPSGHTEVAGLNPTTNPNWKNYTFTYKAVTKADLIKKLRTTHRKIRWKSPVNVQQLHGKLGERYRMYVDEETISDLEDVGEAQNENLGRDIASIDGVTLAFRKHPIVWVPYLDEHAPVTRPIYHIDHATFYPVVLAGDFLRETEPEKKADQHNTFVVYVDLTYNYFCIDRRRNAVGYKV